MTSCIEVERQARTFEAHAAYAGVRAREGGRRAPLWKRLEAAGASNVELMRSLLEPMLIVVMGAAVGGMVISLYMPMFNIIKLIK